MEAIACLENSDCRVTSDPLRLSNLQPPSYSDILLEKCLKYYEHVFGKTEKEKIAEELRYAGHNTILKYKTFHQRNYNDHVYIGELDAKGRL